MRLRLARVLLVLLAVTVWTAGCIVVPVPYHYQPRADYAPAPPPCHRVWVYNHWECR
jgi:hypothetical protein